MSFFLKISVTIKTQRGVFTRESAIYTIPDAEATDLQINGGVLNYPDLRATQFEVLSSTNGSDFSTCRTATNNEPAVFPALRSTKNNLAYAIIDNINLTDQIGGGGGLYPNPFTKSGDAADTNVDRDPNRMLVSETFALFDFQAAKAHYVSGQDDNPIMRFEANTRPVSEGQFGFAPVLVLSKESVQAMEVGEGGSFVRAVPIADRGCVGRYGSANANGFIFMVSGDGVWVLSPQITDEPVSLPLHAFDSADDILDDLDDDSVATYIDDGRGNREVRVGTPSKTYCYSFEYRRWFTLSRGRGVQLRDGNRMLAYDPVNDQITEEVQFTDVGSLTPAGVEGRIKTATLKLGFPGGQKRIYRIGIRQHLELDEIHYLFLDPVDPNNLGGEVDAVISTVDTDAVRAYIDSVTVESPGSLIVGGVFDESWVIGQEIGAVVAAGYFQREGASDVASLFASVARDIYADLWIKGKPGQAIRAFEIEYEPRALHRARRRNLKPTITE